MRAQIIASVAAATVLGLAGCGTAAPTGGATALTPQASAAMSETSGMSAMSATPGSPASSSSTRSGTVEATGARITIASFSYQVQGPVAPGSTVTVRNDDNVAHTVTSDAMGQFDVTVQPHAVATFVAPRTPGRYPLHCTFHPDMHGALVVR